MQFLKIVILHIAFNLNKVLYRMFSWKYVFSWGLTASASKIPLSEWDFP